jgi:hypothetical protein
MKVKNFEEISILIAINVTTESCHNVYFLLTFRVTFN